MTLILGQYDKAMLTKLALQSTYNVNCNNGNLVLFLDGLRVVYYQNNDDKLSYEPYKMIVVIKLLRNFTNSTPKDPRGYKETVKVKYNATTAIVWKVLQRNMTPRDITCKGIDIVKLEWLMCNDIWEPAHLVE